MKPKISDMQLQPQIETLKAQEKSIYHFKGNTRDWAFISESLPVSELGYGLALYFLHQGITPVEFSDGVLKALQFPDALITQEQKKKLQAVNHALQSVQPGSLGDMIPTLRSVKNKHGNLVLLDRYPGHHLPHDNDNPESISPESRYNIEQVSTAAQVLGSQVIFALLDNDRPINSQLTRLNQYGQVNVCLPDENARLHVIKHFIDQESSEDPENKGLKRLNRYGIKKLASKTNGLSVGVLRNFLNWLSVKPDLDIDMALREHIVKELMNDGADIIEILDSDMSLKDIRGEDMESLVTLLKLMLDTLSDRQIAQRLILAGPPGTGKSFIARGIAGERQLITISMKNLKNAFVGQSEQNMLRFIELLKRAIPIGAVLFIDEAELLLPKRNGNGTMDAGVSEFFTKHFLVIMNDLPVFFVLATNHVERMDSAVLDRFLVVPLLKKQTNDLLALTPTLGKQMSIDMDSDLDLVPLQDMMHLNDISARDMKKIVTHASLMAQIETGGEDTPINSQHMKFSAENYLVNTSNLEQELMSLRAIKYAGFENLMPWKKLDGSMRENYNLPNYLEGIIDEDTGRINGQALNQAINELELRIYGRGGYQI